jgi:hypothetical protein
MSLSLWDWEWDELKKRAVTARAVELNRMKGTAHALREYVEIMDGTVVQIVVPPQEFYIGQPLTKEEWDAWIRQMVEVRIKLIEGEGTASYDSWYIQDEPLAPAFESPPEPIALPEDTDFQFGWIGLSFLTDDMGPVLHGRRVITRQDGVDTPAQYVERTTYFDGVDTIDVERVFLPGKSTYGFFIGVSFIGEDASLNTQDIEPQIITVRLDGSYVHESSTLGLTTVIPDLKPQSPRYERNSDIGDAGPYLFLDDFFIGAADVYSVLSGNDTYDYVPAIIQKNRAGDLLADRIYLIDPNVAVPMMEGMSFIGVSRLGMPAFHAEVLVDMHMSQPNEMLFVGESFVGPSLIGELDEKPIDRAIYALRAAKAVRDKVTVRFDPLRQLTPIDVLQPGTKVGDWVPDRL